MVPVTFFRVASPGAKIGSMAPSSAVAPALRTASPAAAIKNVSDLAEKFIFIQCTTASKKAKTEC